MPANPLTDVLPPRARKYVYALLTLAAIVLAGWQVSDGDVWQTIAYVLGALGFGTAASNITSDGE